MNEFEAAVIGDTVPLEDLQACERNYLKQVRNNTLTDNTKFAYAWHLIKSQYSSDVRKGITMMQELCKSAGDKRDYVYLVALGYYRLQEYSEAMKYIDTTLTMEPNNSQAKELKQLIKQKQDRDSMIGLAVVGGATAVAVGATALAGFVISRIFK
ncbi:mitochondrial fission 1 protein-like [Dysidea avara]|uniref:mitochondrial fission 1 protein-like n=1 Tax=Dysidea avara TaxID=196820 RepID=UPI0033325096